MLLFQKEKTFNTNIEEANRQSQGLHFKLYDHISVLTSQGLNIQLSAMTLLLKKKNIEKEHLGDIRVDTR
jgi:hypothetical protein